MCKPTLNQGRRQDAVAGGQKSQRTATFFEYNIDVCSNRHEKRFLRHVNFIHI